MVLFDKKKHEKNGSSREAWLRTATHANQPQILGFHSAAGPSPNVHDESTPAVFRAHKRPGDLGKLFKKHVMRLGIPSVQVGHALSENKTKW